MSTGGWSRLVGKPIQFALLSFCLLHEEAQAQQHVQEPAVDLGDTSFLDAIAAPGWLVEEIADGQHLGQIVNGAGVPVQGASAVNSLSAQDHIAWLSNRRVAGGCLVQQY
jgi:hypothetical protein